MNQYGLLVTHDNKHVCSAAPACLNLTHTVSSFVVVLNVTSTLTDSNHLDSAPDVWPADVASFKILMYVCLKVIFSEVDMVAQHLGAPRPSSTM